MNNYSELALPLQLQLILFIYVLNAWELMLGPHHAVVPKQQQETGGEIQNLQN